MWFVGLGFGEGFNSIGIVKLKDPSDPHPFLDHQIAERAEEAAARVSTRERNRRSLEHVNCDS